MTNTVLNYEIHTACGLELWNKSTRLHGAT
jgi:hypothetical protein